MELKMQFMYRYCMYGNIGRLTSLTKKELYAKISCKLPIVLKLGMLIRSLLQIVYKDATASSSFYFGHDLPSSSYIGLHSF